MISVEKDFTPPPASLLGDRFKNTIEKCLSEKQLHTFTKIYKSDDIINALINIYNGRKCAYCEGKPHKYSPIQVEHYRPKKKSRKKPPLHFGYYWLGYEWTNLIFACERCNKKKGNKFPLDKDGLRVTSPPLKGNKLDITKCKIDYIKLLNEKPVFLNPEVDHPEDHIIFLPSGEAWGITPRGAITITELELNRDELITEGRKKLINRFAKAITLHIANYTSNKINNETLEYNLKIIFSEIWELRLPENEFSRLGYFMFEKFDLFFTRKFGKKARRFLLNRYEAYKEEMIKKDNDKANK